MLEQLQQSLEPILETHGLWLALGLLLLVLVPTLVLFFLRIQQRQGLNTQLQDLLDASGVLYSRLSALDHSLHQYQAQAEAYTGKTQIQVQPLLAPLSENLAQLHRCKVKIKEWEVDLGEQEAETAEQEWQAIEVEAQTLIAGAEKTEGFLKRLSEVEVALQNQLKQIHALLAPYQDSSDQDRQQTNQGSQTSLASLKKRLETLEGSGQTPDPLSDLEAIRQLLQDVNTWVEAEKKADLAAAAAAAEPKAEPIAETQAETQAETAAPVPAAPALHEPESVPEPTTPQPQTQATDAPLSAESAVEISEKPEDGVVETDTAESSPVAEPAKVEEPLVEEPLADEPAEADTLTRAPALTNAAAIDQVLDDALEAVETETTTETGSEDALSQSEPTVELAPPATDKTQDAKAKLEARVQQEKALLLQQQARFLPHLEEIQHALTERFAASLWESSEKHLKRALYKAEEAELLLKLAQRLQQEPAAPVHRVLLNLQRSADKWPEIEKLHQQLQKQHQELELAAEQTLQDCKKLLTLLELPEFENKKDREDYQQAQHRLAGVITQFESAQALDLATAQTDLAWVAHCIQSWKVPSNPEEESMVAL